MAEQVSNDVIVPSFDSPTELKLGQESKANFDNRVDLYPRDGGILLRDVESHLSELADSDGSLLLAYICGMSAVSAAVDGALHFSTPNGGLPIVACSEETYSQSKRYLENFIRNKRAKIVYFDSGDTDDVERVVSEHQPDVIFTETISNYINVPVLNTEHLLDIAKSSKKIPTLVLDNTLPLSTSNPLGKKIKEDNKVIVVESGTKSYLRNKDLLGIAYTKNEELYDYLIRYRRTRGDIPDSIKLGRIDEILPEDKATFDRRNRWIFKNTGDIALNLALNLDPDQPYLVSHPSLPTHENHDFYQETYPYGAAPILYVQSPKVDQLDMVSKLWDHPGVRAQISLGQSFGFDYARLVNDEYVRAIRIGGGAYTNGVTLGQDIAEALNN